ncbi:hypothetical protein ACTXT7_017435 [Hymenolepis weldensis]
MDENPGQSMRNILTNTFECLKEQQYIRNVVHQDLGGYKSYVLRRGGSEGGAHHDALGACVETLQTIVVKPPRIDSVTNGRRSYVFQQGSAPSHEALKI